MTKKLSIFLLSILSFSLFSFSNTKDSISPAKAYSNEQYPSVSTSFYSSCEGLTGTELRHELKSLCTPKSTSYNWERYEAADEAPDDKNSIISIYTRHDIKKSNHVSSSYSWNLWNREHIFTQTAFPNSNTDNHNIFACEGKINQLRGDLKYSEISNHKSPLTIDNHNTYCYKDGNYFEPCDEAKGEVARAVLYCCVVYGYAITDIFSSTDICLKWNVEHPVTYRDIYRNNIVEQLQGNRNPFVDRPSYAYDIWGKYQYQEDDPVSRNTKEIDQLYIDGKANKTVYAPGEIFDPTGLEVVIFYKDGSFEDITNKAVWDNSYLVAGTTSVTVTFEYNGKTYSATYSGITVKKSMDYLFIDGTLIKNEYKVGEIFDPTGLEVYVSYVDGSFEEVTSRVTWDNTPLKEGDTKVKVTFNDGDSEIYTEYSGIVVTKNNNSSSSENDDPSDNPQKRDGGGCSGSIQLSSILISLISLTFIGLILYKQIDVHK